MGGLLRDVLLRGDLSGDRLLEDELLGDGLLEDRLLEDRLLRGGLSRDGLLRSGLLGSDLSRDGLLSDELLRGVLLRGVFLYCRQSRFASLSFSHIGDVLGFLLNVVDGPLTKILYRTLMVKAIPLPRVDRVAWHLDETMVESVIHED